MLEKFTKPDVTHFERKKKGYSPRKKKMKTSPGDERSQSGIGKQHKQSLQKKMGLGHFRKVFIDFAKKRVKCTCDGYRRNGICMESRLYGLLFFETLPPDYCILSVTRGWMNIRHELQKRLYFNTTWSNRRCNLLHPVLSCAKGKCDCISTSEI